MALIVVFCQNDRLQMIIVYKLSRTKGLPLGNT
ncbi:hypothetical protein T12_5536 [Trichinella patagoniensis]|uniref:Uncharacterized protein n=1 Tax=Trichinella patagoniensis TaxID=990121 RepID=A0A0V0YYT3_9BILA|nr:hypothetical protein T12_5536 [Trichinella patagoniensis]